MKKLYALLFASIIPLMTFAQSGGLDQKINEWFTPFSNAVQAVIFYSISINDTTSIPIVLIVLLAGATYFTFYFGFPAIRFFGTAINVVRGKYDDIETDDTAVGDDVSVNVVEGDVVDTIKDESHHGEVSHFQALTAALSATVGLGNIAGVAIAIALGGPGATLWMVLAGFLGMASKFAECTLGVRYREIGPDGTVYGGPMYYLSRGFAEKGLGGLGKGFAVFFAVMCIGGSFGGGNMFQANQAAAQFTSLLGVQSSWAGTAFGVVMAILVAIVIIGGIKRIGKVAEKIVPFMAGIYVLAATIIIVANIGAVPWAFGQIFEGAFTAKGIAGGFVGVLIVGFQRAAFSNEAGVGSAAIAHSAVKTKYAASEGIVALLEPFIDTIVICTMTALVIIIFNHDGQFVFGQLNAANEVVITATGEGLGGVNLTARAFDSVIPGFSYILTIAVILFAFSTMLSWSYYGLQSWKYLFGRSMAVDYTYKILFCLMVVVGAASSLSAVVGFSDAMIFAMVFPNIIGVILLAPRVKEELEKYLNAIKK
ncbi:MAG: alanine/glycine:cation symporter family protein [Bacteroidota bacterium]